jgi:hypothetical protein
MEKKLKRNEPKKKVLKEGECIKGEEGGSEDGREGEDVEKEDEGSEGEGGAEGEDPREKKAKAKK